MHKDFFIEGKIYTDTARAASSVGYSEKYVQSLARKGVVKAHRVGSGSSGMLSGSMGLSMGALGSGMSAMGMASKVSALGAAVALVFGLYSFTDPAYSRYVHSELETFSDKHLSLTQDITMSFSEVTNLFSKIALEPEYFIANIISIIDP